MNKDQVKGSVKVATGKVQQKIGEIIGNEEQQVEGHAKQIEGKLQKAVGNVKESLKDATN